MGRPIEEIEAGIRFLWVFDFDGTLSPIVEDRHAAPIHPMCRELLNGLSRIPTHFVVVLSSREIEVIIAKDVATRGMVSVFRDDTLQQALDKMAAIGVDELPVVDRKEPDTIVSMISKRDIVNYYYDKSTG